MRRVVALLAVLCLSLLGLTACGDDDGVENSGSVTVTGDFGAKPEVTYDGQVVREDTKTEVLIEGKGEKVAADDIVYVHLYSGNGFTGEEIDNSFEPPEGSKDAEAKPLALKVNDILKVLKDALDGSTVGSRILVEASPKDATNEQGNPDAGIGNQDAVVYLVDVLGKVLDAPEGTEKPLPSGLPTIVEKDGKPTGLDFSGAAPKAGDKLRVIPLVQGDGPAIEKGSQVALRYLGQEWGGKEKFDENYSADFPGIPGASGQPEPVTIPGSWIKGWNQGLIGVKQGSRILLVVPTELGYGPKPKKDDGKPHGDLVFIIDVLGVA